MKLSKYKEDLLIEYSVNKKLLNTLKSSIDFKIPDRVKDSNCSVGLEFEFYIGKDSGSFKEHFDHLIKERFGQIIENLVFVKEDTRYDKNNDFWYLERDGSLNENNRGYELVSPKMDLEDALFYIYAVNSIIENHCNTTDKCAFHIHLSSKDLGSITPSKMVLLSNGMFENWSREDEYNENIFEKFTCVNPGKFDDLFCDLTKRLSITSCGNDLKDNHIEIRTFGGMNYEKRSDEIVADFINFIDESFIPACTKEKDLLYGELLDKHMIENGETFKEPLCFDEIKSGLEKVYNDFDNSTDRIDTTVLILDYYSKEGRLVPVGKLLQDANDYFLSLDVERSSSGEQESGYLEL